MRYIYSVAGAFIASVLLMAIVDIYTPGRTALNLPLIVIFIIIWSVGFGYATIEANLRRKIISVLVIEGLALTGSSGYFIFTRGFDDYIYGFVLGIASLLIVFMLFVERGKS
jgi:hypothetical protein